MIARPWSRKWRRARRIRRAGRNTSPWSVDVLASLIAVVRRPNGVES